MAEEYRSPVPVYATEHKAPALGPGPYALVGVMVGNVVWAAWVATQYVAERLGYHENLGAPLVSVDRGWGVWLLGAAVLAGGVGVGCYWWRPVRRFGGFALVAGVVLLAASRGALYSPVEIVVWFRAYHGIGEIRAILDSAQYAAAVGIVPFALASMSLVSSGKSRVASTAHGSARFGRGDEHLLPEAEREKAREAVAEAGAQGKNVDQGLLIGRHDSGDLFWYTGDSHVLTMAPTRSGKGVGAVIPNLLRYPGSVVCTDVKGENFHVTHRARLNMGHAVFALDPFGETGEHGSHGYLNPLEIISFREDDGRAAFAVDDARALAEVLVPEQGKESSHWTGEARNLLAGLLAYVAWEGDAGRFPPEERSLIKVRELLVAPAEQWEEMLTQMALSQQPFVKATAARIEQKDERERSGVISTAQQSTAFLDSPQMASVLGPAVGSEKEGMRRERVPIDQLKPSGGKQALDLYIVIPPRYLETHAAWLRLVVVCCDNTITRIPGKPASRILMLLDEFANLGPLNAVIRGISLVGGYGVAYWLIVQDLSQLKGVYRDNHGTIFANTDVKQLFGTNDYETAELLSKMTGEATVFTEGGSTGSSRSYGKSDGGGRNAGDSFSEKGRRLLNADEVMRLHRDNQLLFVRGSFPLVTRKLRYFADAEFVEVSGEPLFDPNPMNEAPVVQTQWSGTALPMVETM